LTFKILYSVKTGIKRSISWYENRYCDSYR